ncbi:ribosome maturation factor RimP [Peptacetobacter hiranonis]|uniref:ribosome maturation factor RimP n=1 Tax=Peptacetobacter hiranonis TaxID=89152 RepID=UPI002E781086|nr:ribosome maturation factor RimP [Peptacetobacter hiranonis]MEE0249284.1 ribosome maturation factor RimP [Peptacetobacter hiranonis]
MKKSEIVDRVEKMVTAITDEKGYEMVDVEYVKEAGQFYLRVVVDKEGGISLNECEEVSRELSPKLDENDFIKENYYLEVSSPGIDRALKRDKEFVKYKGRDVEIKLYKAIDGVKQFEGELVGLDEENNIVVIINNEEMKFNRKDVAIIRLAIKF